MENGSNIQHNAYGFYAMGQQMLWRSAANPSTNFSLWGGLTFSPQQDIFAPSPHVGSPVQFGRASFRDVIETNSWAN
jgi:hypothetical protein